MNDPVRRRLRADRFGTHMRAVGTILYLGMVVACGKSAPPAQSAATRPPQSIPPGPPRGESEPIAAVTHRSDDLVRIEAVQLMLLGSNPASAMLEPSDTTEDFNVNERQVLVSVQLSIGWKAGWQVIGRAKEGSVNHEPETRPVLLGVPGIYFLYNLVGGCTPLVVTVDLLRPDGSVAQREEPILRLACAE